MLFPAFRMRRRNKRTACSARNRVVWCQGGAVESVKHRRRGAVAFQLRAAANENGRLWRNM
jgi:hypothetical protein